MPDLDPTEFPTDIMSAVFESGIRRLPQPGYPFAEQLVSTLETSGQPHFDDYGFSNLVLQTGHNDALPTVDVSSIVFSGLIIPAVPQGLLQSDSDEQTNLPQQREYAASQSRDFSKWVALITNQSAVRQRDGWERTLDDENTEQQWSDDELLLDQLLPDELAGLIADGVVTTGHGRKVVSQ